MRRGTLEVRVVEAADLVAADSNGLSDPYVKLSLGAQKKKSKKIKKTLNPKWNESFTFHVGDLGREKLRIAVWDHDTLSRGAIVGKYRRALPLHLFKFKLVDVVFTLWQDDPLGAVTIPLSDLEAGVRHDAWYELHEIEHGKIHMSFMFMESDIESKTIRAGLMESGTGERFKLVKSVLSHPDLAALPVTTETFIKKAVSDKAIFRAEEESLLDILYEVGVEDEGDQHKFVEVLRERERGDEYLMCSSDTTVNDAFLWGIVDGSECEEVLTRLREKAISSVGHLRMLHSSQWGSLGLDSEQEQRFKKKIWQPIVLDSSDEESQAFRVRTSSNAGLGRSGKFIKSPQINLQRRGSSTTRPRTSSGKRTISDPTVPEGTNQIDVASRLHVKDIALNGLPFVDAGEILQCGEVRAVEGLEAEWSSAAKALKKSRGVIKRNSSIGVRRRSDSSSSICTMVQSAASGIPAKVFGLCVGYDSVAVIAMKELLIRVRPDMHPSTTGSLDTNVGASTWNGVVLGSHVLQVGVLLVNAGVVKKELFGWGCNVVMDGSEYHEKPGLLGLGDEIKHSEAVNLSSRVGGRPLAAAAGPYMSAVITRFGGLLVVPDGAGTGEGLFTCGVEGLVALGRSGPSSVLLPVDLREERVVQVACGRTHMLALTARGEVLSCGRGSWGQLGLGGLKLEQKTLAGVPGIFDVTQISAGHFHSGAVDMNGEVTVWGSNKRGQLGIKRESAVWSPMTLPLSTTRSVRVASLSFCGESSMFVTDLGTVWVCGKVWGFPWKGTDTPVLLEGLEKSHAWIVQGGIGRSMYMVMRDDWLSELLQAFINMCDSEHEVQLNYLKNMIVRLPKKLFRRVHTRAALHLMDQRGAVPTSTDVNLVEFQPKEKTKNTVRIFKVTNDSAVRVNVEVSMPASEMYSNSRYSFSFEPASFVLDKKQSQVVRVSLTCARAAFESAMFLFTTTAVPVKKKGPGIRHFLIALVKPIDQRKDLKPAVTPELVQTMSSYVPQFIMKDVCKQPQPRREPEIQRFPACILFIDVSGFTALNERLAKLGPAGPEQVSKHLNAYFGQLIDAVNDFGGDVLKFAGDALICMFGDDRKLEDPKKLCLRATQSAMYIQTALDKYDSGEGFVLTLHVGIGYGDMYSLYVGGVDGGWEFLVVGEPFLQLKTSVDLSKAGEVVVSQKCWDLIKDRCSGEPREDDWLITGITEPLPKVPIEHAPISTEYAAHLRGYIQTGVQARLDARQAQWIAELRRITVLFVKLNSLTYNPDTPFDWNAVNEVLRFMQSVIFRYEGMVRQFLVDDKGTVLIAVFGVPPFSHEALEIHHTLLRRGMDNSIGITSGEVFCGSVGSSKRQEYAMVGDIVNLSARLMVAAGKLGAGLLCDQVTYEASTQRLDFDRRDPIMVKGKSVPIDIYVPKERDESEVIKEAQTEDPDQVVEIKTRFISGRANEIGIFKGLLDALVKDRNARVGSVTVICGAAGVGKSVLLEYLRDMVTDVRFGYFRYFIQVVRSAADSVEKNTPYFMWKNLLVELLYLDQFLGFNKGGLHVGKADAIDPLSKAKKEINREFRAYLPLLNHILPLLHLPESEETKVLTSSQRQQKLYELIMHILEKRNARRALVLLFDNFQWADRSSMELVQAIAKNLPTVMMVIAHRPFPDPPPVVFSGILSLPGTAKHELPAMSPAELRAVLMHVFEVSSIPQELEAELAKAEGNPLFCQEIVNGLVDAGAVNVVNGEFEILGDLSKVSIPSTVQGMVTSRIDRLPAPLQMVLKVGSVIGFEFSKEMLNAVYPIEEEKPSLKYHLRQLRTEGFLEKKFTPQGTAVKGIELFKNDIIQKVAYNRMLFLQRQKLHRQIAEFMETVYADQVDAMSAQLAHHWAAVLDGAADPDQPTVLKALSYVQRTINQLKESNGDIAQWQEQGQVLIGMLHDKKEQAKYKKGFA